MKKLPLLGDITPAQFLRDYWHKKPLVIRQAIPGFKPLLSVEALAELATHDHVESRLVTAGGGHWDMQTGPLEAIPLREQKEWTLLVQGVNLHDARADALLRQFRFIPDARLDDLMVSFATDGGGVGPHFDSYDVFLLQAAGQRRWRIGPQKDLSVVEGLPLKILAKFKPNEEFVLEPGDMLYLRRTTRTTASPSATARPIRSASVRRPIRNWARPSCNSWPTRSTCRAATPIRIWKPAPSRPRSRATCSTAWPRK